MRKPEENRPTTFIIFGATGDLASRKLFPSLFDLYDKGLLPSPFNIVGFSRSDFSHVSFRAHVRDALAQRGHNHMSQTVEEFLKSVSFVQGDFTVAANYETLRTYIESIDERIGQCMSKLIYLAVPPAFYSGIFSHLSQSRLANVCNADGQWTRILVEKPFGFDRASAAKLEAQLAGLFNDDQIYRIDHYLAKETLENILAFRFSNVFFEPVWSRKYISRVYIRMSEQFGVSGRGSFYDKVGAVRDVGQNHVLQMLALIAMDSPGALSASLVRKKREEVLSKLTLALDEPCVRAQYDGYQEIEGVDIGSETETYFKASAYIENDRWSGVPFVLEAGKSLDKTATEIIVEFKHGASCICSDEAGHTSERNEIVFRVQPNEGIDVRFTAKAPGFAYNLESKELSFDYDTSPRFDMIPDAYERVLFDCIRGDQTRFPSSGEVAAQWRYIEMLRAQLENIPLSIYKSGTRPA